MHEGAHSDTTALLLLLLWNTDENPKQKANAAH